MWWRRGGRGRQRKNQVLDALDVCELGVAGFDLPVFTSEWVPLGTCQLVSHTKNSVVEVVSAEAFGRKPET